jgi:hypothetical protein
MPSACLPRNRYSFAPFALTLLTLACAESTVPRPPNVTGHWMVTGDLSPSGRYEDHLTFTTLGAFKWEVRFYGPHPDRPADRLDSYSRTEGTYQTEGDRILFQPARLVWWDAFYGDDSPVNVQSPYPYGTLFDDARFVLGVGRLTLNYLSYPFDAPVPTTMEFIRAP